MTDLIDGGETSQPDADGKYPKARRTYRILGAMHFLLFSVGLTAKALENGAEPVIAVLAGLSAGGLFIAVFEPLARHHYHGRVPGKGR